MPYSVNEDTLRTWIDMNRQRLRLAVIFGGDAAGDGATVNQTYSFRPWKSYEQVAENIGDQLRDFGIGSVILVPDDRALLDRLLKEKINYVWLNTGGMQGDAPLTHTPGLLEMLGIPYVGHCPLTAGVLDNKHIFKLAAASMGFHTPAYCYFDHRRLQSVGGARLLDSPGFQSIFADWPGPFVLKPAMGRASIMVQFAEDRQRLKRLLDLLSNQHRNFLVEKYLSGREYCVAVAGPVLCRGGRLSLKQHPVAFSALERRLEESEKIFTGMDKKSITAARVKPVAKSALKQELYSLSTSLFEQLGLRSIIRLDMRADETGQINILEANPKPDLKQPDGQSASLVALGLEEKRMSYADLIQSLFLGSLFDYLAHRPRYLNRITHPPGAKGEASWRERRIGINLAHPKDHSRSGVATLSV